MTDTWIVGGPRPHYDGLATRARRAEENARKLSDRNRELRAEVLRLEAENLRLWRRVDQGNVGEAR